MVLLRRAEPSDAASIAALHADSWRRHYRGAYSDHFLDGDLDADRLEVWTKRLAHPGDNSITIVAQNDPDVGAHDDGDVGALKRGGIGTALLDETARRLAKLRPSSGLYLFVLAQNTAAQAFYDARRGVAVERLPTSAPAGDPANLAGAPDSFRYAWTDPSALVVPRRARQARQARQARAYAEPTAPS